jgi:hypothetical protein
MGLGAKYEVVLVGLADEVTQQRQLVRTSVITSAMPTRPCYERFSVWRAQTSPWTRSPPFAPHSAPQPHSTFETRAPGDRRVLARRCNTWYGSQLREQRSHPLQPASRIADIFSRATHGSTPEQSTQTGNRADNGLRCRDGGGR